MNEPTMEVTSAFAVQTDGDLVKQFHSLLTHLLLSLLILFVLQNGIKENLISSAAQHFSKYPSRMQGSLINREVSFINKNQRVHYLMQDLRNRLLVLLEEELQVLIQQWNFLSVSLQVIHDVLIESIQTITHIHVHISQ